MIAAGEQLPSVALASTRGGVTDLSKETGKAVVFVYPYTGRPGVADPPGWDDIPGAHGSTPEAQGFRDLHEDFKRAGYEVYGLSGQSAAWQREAATRLALPFALLSDEGFVFADSSRLPRFKAGTSDFLKRLTMIVSEGVVVRVVYPVPDPAGHARALLEMLAGAG